MKLTVTVILVFISFVSLHSQVKFKPIVSDNLSLADKAIVRGHIGKKLDQSYQNRILAQDVDHLIEPFRHRTESRMWQSEFWGKWFTSAVLAYRYRPEEELKKILDAAVKGLLATQSADGYIGNYKEENRLEQWDIWGRKYVMLGLLDYYDLTHDKKTLQAAQKVADHLILEVNQRDGKIVNKGNYRGMAASSVLEPIVRLYASTNNKKYLDFATKIVAEWETPEGPQLISKAGVDVNNRFPKPANWYSPEQGQKAYEMMSCYEGLLELYRITGNTSYKEAVENVWRNILNTEINIAGSGAAMEMWFGGTKLQTTPIKHYQETCVTVTWIKLNQQLLKLTGEAKYADEIERTYYNALLGSLSEDGADWAKYTPLRGQRLPGSGQCGMHLNCCNASGPRGQFTLPLTAVMSMKHGLSVNFFVDGLYQVKSPKGNDVKVIQKTDYPETGKIDISFDLPAEEEMALRIRIPSWSKTTTVTVNNEEIKNVKQGSYVEVKRRWSSKDNVTVNLDMQGRVVTHGEANEFAAIIRGPIVLARDSRLPGPHLTTIATPVANADGEIELQPEGINKEGIWMQYKAMFIPESYAEFPADPISIVLCNYSSAGYGPEKSSFMVWMPQLYNPQDH